MAGTVEISSGLNARSAMQSAAANEFKGVVFLGEPDFIGSADEGDTIDFILAYYGQEAASSGGSNWEYDKSDLAFPVGGFLKAWLHWNGSGFDLYLKCAQSADGSTGFASHAMPYIQP